MPVKVFTLMLMFYKANKILWIETGGAVGMG